MKPMQTATSMTDRKNFMLTSELLLQLPGIVHGFAGKRLGDGRRDETAQNGLRHLNLSGYNPRRMKQVHGTDVIKANGFSGLPVADGLMLDAGSSHIRREAACVVTADCLPILFADPVRRTVVAVHAGWKGTIGRIAEGTVSSMLASGSSISDIRVAVGPHIGGCCYTVDKDRAGLFANQYGERVVSLRDGRWHLDLGEATRQQLDQSGIAAGQIDLLPVCTSCDHDFYSYRRDVGDRYGENISVIAVGA
jgi:polyphenol oxidase